MFSFTALKVKSLFFLLLITLSFTSCSYHKIPVNLSGTNDFHSLISKAVDKSAKKIKRNIGFDEIVLVSDFVNLDKLKNRSQLGFLLSDILKDKLLSLDIIVREVEFGKNFEIGKRGFNVLTRDKREIVKDKVTKAKYAVVGTYSITTRSLNIFIKLIDVNNGNILASSYERTAVDKEILQLEGEDEKRVILRPHVVL